jgi:hypothetical protein
MEAGDLHRHVAYATRGCKWIGEPLPIRIFTACTRPFAWRKKWARDWERVLYCSDAGRIGQIPFAGSGIAGY